MDNFLIKYFIFNLNVYMYESMCMCCACEQSALRVQMLGPEKGVMENWVVPDICAGADVLSSSRAVLVLNH